MAFCNSCGATLAAGAQFCNKCGASVLASGTVPAATSSIPAASVTPVNQGGSALKVILIVVAVIVGLGILGVAGAGFFAWHIAKNSHVRQDGDSVKVETPFGTMESSQDPEEAARNLGVDVYPGAKALKEGSAVASFGGVHTVTVNFETSDPVDKVCTFYKSRFPRAHLSTSEEKHCTIVSNQSENLVTINVEAEDDNTQIHISNVNRKGGAPNPSSDQ